MVTLSGRFIEASKQLESHACSPRPTNLEQKLMVVMAARVTSDKIDRDR
jgi:hypothetical protein